MTRLYTKFVESRSSFGIMLMTEEDYAAMYTQEYYVTDGYIDYVRAYKAGVRIFLFVENEGIDHEGEQIPGWLESNPKALPFVTGSWDDLDRIRRSGKITLRQLGNSILNPLQNRIAFDPEKAPEINISAVSADVFLKYFGIRERTIRFVRSTETESDEKMIEV